MVEYIQFIQLLCIEEPKLKPLQSVCITSLTKVKLLRLTESCCGRFSSEMWFDLLSGPTEKWHLVHEVCR